VTIESKKNSRYKRNEREIPNDRAVLAKHALSYHSVSKGINLSCFSHRQDKREIWECLLVLGIEGGKRSGVGSSW